MGRLRLHIVGHDPLLSLGGYIDRSANTQLMLSRLLSVTLRLFGRFYVGASLGRLIQVQYNSYNG